MKKRHGFLCIILLVFVMSAGSAEAIPVDFGDTAKQWTSAFGNMPNQDVYGTPDIQGGSAEVSATGKLSSVTINIKSVTNYWYLLDPGSLFIDKEADGVWDYLVDTAVDVVSGSDAPGNYDLYSVSQPFDSSLTNSNYRYSYSLQGGSWRTGAPVSLIDGYLSGKPKGSASFSGWPTNVPLNQTASITYSNFSFSIDLGDDFTIGWAPSCANDVLLQTMSNPVPEPATMLLLGTGLIGLAGLGKRKFIKK